MLGRVDTAQAPALSPQPGARMRRVPLPAGRGVARTRASRRDVLRRATPDITGLCVVAARLFSAASPGEGGAAFAVRAGLFTADDPVAAESLLPLRCFSGHWRRGPVASSSSAQLTPRALGLQLS